MGCEKMYMQDCWGKLCAGRHWGKLGIDEKIILNLIFK